MRKYQLITSALFAKTGEDFQEVSLPHTWNAEDGQNGTEYWRGTGNYCIDLPNPTPGKRQYIEFGAANHEAAVQCN